MTKIIFQKSSSMNNRFEWPTVPRVGESIRIQLSNDVYKNLYRVTAVEWADSGAAKVRLEQQ